MATSRSSSSRAASITCAKGRVFCSNFNPDFQQSTPSPSPPPLLAPSALLPSIPRTILPHLSSCRLSSRLSTSRSATATPPQWNTFPWLASLTILCFSLGAVIYWVAPLSLLSFSPNPRPQFKPGLNEVIYGSIMKLMHERTQYRLHSHEIPYGSGSGQQSLTGFKGVEDANSHWVWWPAMVAIQGLDRQFLSTRPKNSSSVALNACFSTLPEIPPASSAKPGCYEHRRCLLLLPLGVEPEVLGQQYS